MTARHGRDDEPTPTDLPLPGRTPLYLVPPGSAPEAAAVLAAVDALRSSLVTWIAAAESPTAARTHHRRASERAFEQAEGDTLATPGTGRHRSPHDDG